MSIRSRRGATLVATLGAALSLAACSEGPAAVAPRLAPDATPNNGYAVPYGCTTAQSCVGAAGDPITAITARREQLQVCKRYPAGVAGPAVTIHVHAVSQDPNPDGTPYDFDYTLPANSCRIIWNNGEAYSTTHLKHADVLTVTEVVPAGYASTSQVMTVIATDAVVFQHTQFDTTKYAPTSATTATGSIGGYQVPGMTVVFTNTPIPTTYAIGDRVWNDLDADGIQDAGEPGLAGIAVTLTKGAVTQTTTTDANGLYAFANLVAGTYAVSVGGTPIGFVASPSNAGADDAVDSDGSGVSVVVAGGSDTSIDFGFHEAIGGMACTYTQGYWKTHEASWPAPYAPDARWMTPQRQVSGLTWDGLFGLAPKGGNSYVQLAHQWMAAKLNRANGAPTSAGVLQALNAAEAWLLANTPVNGALPSIKNAPADAWASTLDTFNNGLAGTPHCD